MGGHRKIRAPSRSELVLVDRRVAGRGQGIRLPHQFLDDPNVGACPERPGRIGAPAMDTVIAGVNHGAMPVWPAVLLAGVIGLTSTGCGGDDSTSVGTDAHDSPSASSSSPDARFVSETYGYSVESVDWYGLQANERWDGTGSPSFTDPVVDRLASERGDHTAFVYAAPTTLPLDEWTRQARARGRNVRQCPTTLDATNNTVIGGEPAILDQTHCPPGPKGAYVLVAYAIHGGRGYVFFTFDTRTPERSTRRGFTAFLRKVAFRS